MLSIVKHMKAANLSCSVEECNPMNDTRERPGDIYIAEFDSLGHGPGDAFFDISVIHICAESYIRRASVGQLEGSNIRYNEKMLKYPDLKSRFKPLVVESTGGWHPFSFKDLKDIADRMAGMSRLSAVDALSKLLSSASFCLQRHQGSQLARRCLGVF